MPSGFIFCPLELNRRSSEIVFPKSIVWSDVPSEICMKFLYDFVFYLTLFELF